MNTLKEIRHAIDRLSHLERQELFCYLQPADGLLHTGDAMKGTRTDCTSSASDYLTREEFLEFQERSSTPYEYINGVIRQIIGPSVAHCIVTQNLCDAIRARLRGRRCKTFSSGPRLNMTLDCDEVIYRPDLFVACENSGGCQDCTQTPKLVVEVVSPSTQDIDKREKLANYRRVPSLDEYVVAAQKCVELTIYRRAENWAPDVVNSLHAAAELRSLGLSIPLVEIYERVFSDRIAANSTL
jgi:Uma2 family endonuclease